LYGEGIRHRRSDGAIARRGEPTGSSLTAVGVNRGRSTLIRFLNKAYLVSTDSRAELGSEEGQALVEYALILAMITVISIAALQALGIDVSRFLDKVSTSLSSVAG
jgi:Flp pilus assembly pilin Flp